jgi:drug/metabolite transporter (DMT)-like permease
VGVAAAVGTAIFSAGTALLLRGPVLKIGSATAQTWRAIVSALIFAVVFLVLRRPGDLFALPGRAVAVLLASVLLNMVLGDIFQFSAMRRLGVALAMPIASSYPLVTVLIAVPILGEPFTLRAVAGAVLVVGGVVLVVLPRRALDATGTPHHVAPVTGYWVGVALALAASVCLAVANILTRVALRDLDVVTANMLRLPFGAVLCALIGTVQRRQPPWRVERRSILPLCLAGLTGLGSSICFLVAIVRVGASTTATLNAAAPIFGLFGAVLFLRERPTRRSVVGTLVAFVGVTLVV